MTTGIYIPGQIVARAKEYGTDRRALREMKKARLFISQKMFLIHLKAAGFSRLIANIYIEKGGGNVSSWRNRLILLVTLYGVLSGLAGFCLFSSHGEKSPLLAVRPLATAAAQPETNPEPALTVQPPPATVVQSASLPDKPKQNQGKIAYLTFDDGPSQEVTPLILETLKKYEVKATFFVIGRAVEANPDLARAIVDQGHSLGNHTYSHQYAQIYKSPQTFIDDLLHGERVITEVTGVKPRIMRAPGGSNAFFTQDYLKALSHLDYVYFDWNVSSRDAALGGNIPAADITRFVLTQARENKKSIILMHDARDKLTTAAALPDIIAGLKEQGFDFQVLTPEVTPVQFLVRTKQPVEPAAPTNPPQDGQK